MTTNKTYGPRQRDRMERDAQMVWLWAMNLAADLDGNSLKSKIDSEIDVEKVRKVAQVIADVAQRIADVKPSKAVEPSGLHPAYDQEGPS